MLIKTLILLFIPIVSLLGQASHTDQEYKDFIDKFYYFLCEDTLVTIAESIKLFGITSLEDEEAISYRLCKEKYTEKICEDLVKERFEKISMNDESYLFSEIKKLKAHFIADIDNPNNFLIEKYDELYESTIAYDITFPDGRSVYFYLNRYPDEPIEITNLYLEDGASLEYHLSENKEVVDLNYVFLKRKGIICDEDGFSNVRAGSGMEFCIVGKFLENEIFYYTPNFYCDWWKVKSIDNSIVGFMHRSRIKPFGELSIKSKELLRLKYE